MIAVYEYLTSFFLLSAMGWSFGHGHLVKIENGKSKSATIYKYFIFIYSEQWPRSRNWFWPNDLDQMTTDCKYKTMCIWKCYLLHMLIPMTKPLPWFRALVLTLTICNIFMIEVIDSEYTQESANETNWKHNSSNNKINGSLEKNQGGNEMLPPFKKLK